MPMATVEDQRKFQRERCRKRRAYAVAIFGGKCQKCGSTDKLEFDHVDPKDKKYNISNMWQWKSERIREELLKCQLLCSRCHRDKTGRCKHGSKAMYTKHKCRCVLCKEWNKLNMRKSRAKNPQIGRKKKKDFILP